jgi:hypothetical protein
MVQWMCPLAFRGQNEVSHLTRTVAGDRRRSQEIATDTKVSFSREWALVKPSAHMVQWICLPAKLFEARMKSDKEGCSPRPHGAVDVVQWMFSSTLYCHYNYTQLYDARMKSVKTHWGREESEHSASPRPNNVVCVWIITVTRSW